MTRFTLSAPKLVSLWHRQLTSSEHWVCFPTSGFASIVLSTVLKDNLLVPLPFFFPLWLDKMAFDTLVALEPPSSPNLSASAESHTRSLFSVERHGCPCWEEGYSSKDETIFQDSSQSVPIICFILPQNLQTYPRTKPMEFKVLLAAGSYHWTRKKFTKIISTTFILSSKPAVLSQSQQRSGVSASRGITDSL